MSRIQPRRNFPLTTPSFDVAEVEAVAQCLSSGWVTQGPATQRFEQLFAAQHGVRHASATTSCTAALHLSTAALRLGPGDEVVVPAFTWVTSAHAAEYVGAKAVFADVDLATFNISPIEFERAITPRTKAVVVVHLFGHAAPMDEITSIARRYGIKVIEDAACAVGTTYAGRPIGGLGDLGCFSFHPRKVITTGEGGMVTTNDAALSERVQCLRNHGATGHPGPQAGPSKPYSMGDFNDLGFNLRLSDIQAAVGVAQMAKLDFLLSERRSAAERYLDLLAETEELALPYAAPHCGHTYQSFVVRLIGKAAKWRNEVMEELSAAGVQTRPGTHAVHRLGYYRNKYGLRSDDFPAAVSAEDTTITLPIFPGITHEDQAYIAGSLIKALRQRSARAAA